MIAEWVKSSFEAVSTDTIIHGFDKVLMKEPEIDDLNSSFMSLDINDVDY